MLKNKELFTIENEIKWLEMKTKYVRLSELDIYEGQPDVLAYIYMHEHCNQYEVAKYLGLSRASIGISIKRMAKSGWLNVEASEKDARSTSLSITKQGIKVLVQSDMVLDEYMSKKYDALSEQELKQYVTLLAKIKRNLSKLYVQDTNKKHKD